MTSKLFPLDGCWGFASAIQYHAVNLAAFVGDAGGDGGEHVVGHARPVGGHGVLRADRAQDDGGAVGALVALDAHRVNVGEQYDRALPDVAVEAGAGEFFAGDGVGLAQQVETFPGDFADDADAQARAGEGLAPDDLVGQAELGADGAHLVLEEGAQRFDELELDVLGQAADVVVGLDVGRAVAAAGFDDVGVEGALHEELDFLAAGAGLFEDLTLGFLEGADELLADDLALALGLGDALERFEEVSGGVDGDQSDAGGGDEVVLDLLDLAFAQQAVVDEHAGELVADGLVDEGSGDCGVDTAGQAADHFGVADLLADLGDLVLDDGGGVPVVG